MHEALGGLFEARNCAGQRIECGMTPRPVSLTCGHDTKKLARGGDYGPGSHWCCYFHGVSGAVLSVLYYSHLMHVPEQAIVSFQALLE